MEDESLGTSKVIRKLGGFVRCTSWKHWQRSCRQSKAGTEGSKQNNNHYTKEAAEQKICQPAVRSKHEDRSQSQKKAQQQSLVKTWRNKIKGRAAEKNNSPQQATAEDNGCTPHVVSPQGHRSSENSKTRLQRNSNSDTDSGPTRNHHTSCSYPAPSL